MTISQRALYPDRNPGASLAARVGRAAVSDRARFVALVLFLSLVAVTGGSSRSDIPALMILRPLAVAACCYALLVADRGAWRPVRAPLLIVTGLMLLCLLQLIPLPAGVWERLPGREVVAEASAMVGLGGIARPLSLDPHRTWNTFFSLFVPLAVVCLVAVQSPSYRQRVIPALAILAIASAAAGYLQSIGGSGLHLYAITHRDFPVGLFANKNHQSVMLLWLMLAASWLAATARSRRFSANAIIGGALAVMLVIFPLLILTGSRAGLLLAPVVLLLCGWLLMRAPATRNLLKRSRKRARIAIGGAAAGLTAPLVFVFAVLATSGRETALSRLFERDVSADQRWEYMPQFLEMARDFMPFGSGFGSFEQAFNMYEPANSLSTYYMNQVHNDPLQVIIEGGLAGGFVMLVALAWFLLACWRVWRSDRPNGRSDAVLFAGSMALWLVASVVDYPLRTPLAAAVVAALTAQLAFRSTRTLSGEVEQVQESRRPVRYDGASR